MDVSYCTLVDGMDIQSPLNALFEKNVECNYKILSKKIFWFGIDKNDILTTRRVLHLTIIHAVLFVYEAFQREREREREREHMEWLNKVSLFQKETFFIQWIQWNHLI